MIDKNSQNSPLSAYGNQPRLRNELPVMWFSSLLDSDSISVELIEPFNAQGLKLRYGRGDHFTRRVFNMDVWTNREGRMFARFWSRCIDVDTESYEVFGVPLSSLGDGRVEEEFIPLKLRQAYANWIISNF
jgi:hypothetical protein